MSHRSSATAVNLMGQNLVSRLIALRSISILVLTLVLLITNGGAG